MSLKPLNSVGGFSVGETPSNIILANGDITTTAITVSGVSNLGPVGNVIISGGTSGYYLQTNGSGNLSWAAVPTGTGISNGTSNVNIPVASSNVVVYAGGNNTANFTDTGANISGTLNVTGNANTGNIGATGGYFTTVAGSLTTAAQPNITSVGTLTSLGVTGNVTAGNLIGPLANGNSNVNIPSANGNVNISVTGTPNVVVVTGTGVNVSGTLNATGNANAGNVGATGGYFTTVSGGLTTASQPNITSVGTLTGLTVNGVTNLGPVGNVTITGGTSGQYLQTNGSGVLTWQTISTSSISNGNSNVSIPDANGNVNISAVGNANVFVVTGTGANISGTLNVTGNANAGNIGAAAGVFTTVAGSLTTAAQTNVTSVGTLISLDVSGNATVGNLLGPHANGNSNVNIPAANGNVNISAVGNANVVVVTGSGVNVSGTLNATGNANVGNIGAAAGVFTTVAGSLTTAAQPNITSVGTLTSLDVSGNTTSGNFIGVFANGNSNVNIPAANGNVNISAAGNANIVTVTGTGANVSGTFDVTGNANVGNLGTATAIITTGNITTINSGLMQNGTSNLSMPSSSGNINMSVNGNANVVVVTGTGVNVAGTLSTGTGNANVGNLGATQVLATANVIAPQLISNIAIGTAPLVVTSTTRVANLNVETAGAADTAGTVTVGAQPNITSVGTLSSLTVSGNTTSGNFIGVFANGTSNVNIPTASGNVTVSAAGNANIVVVTGTGVNVAGTLNTGTGNANVGNLGATEILATANVTAPQLISNVSTGTAPLVVSSTTKVANLNVDLLDGYSTDTAATASTVVVRDANANITANYISGTLSTASQPNITSVGTLTSLDVSGNTTSGNFIGVFANGNSNVSIPSANGNVNISAVGVANVVTVTGTGVNVSGTLNTGTGNANVGNLGTSQVLATANVTAPVLISNVLTGTSPLTVTSTTKVANLNVDQVDGYDTAITSTASTIVVRDANANIYANNISGTLTTASQTNITSVGTLGSLAVTANITAGNVYANSGTIGASLLAGTLTTAAQPNVTSVGTLSTLTVSGNANVGNIGANNAVFTGTGSFGGNVNMGNFNITNLAEPNAASDAATKAYVDAAVTGLHVHDSCYVATTGNLDVASGGTVSYNNGTLGVGANLVTTGTFYLIDGGNVQTVGTRILVKNEANAAWNGIYTYANTTTLVRATDFDTSAEAAGGDFVFVTSGSTQADTGWVQTTDNPTIGTSDIVFTQFSGAGTYTAGTGLTLTGTVFSITNTAVSAGSYGNGDRVASFTVNAQGQLTAASNVVIAANAANLTGTTLNSSIVTSSLTSVGTLGSLSVSGNATVGNLLGVFANGNSNVSIPSANGNVNISAVGNANVLVISGTGISVTGTLTTGTGNANVGNLGASQVLATANVTAPQLISNVSTGTAPLVVTSTTQVANLNVATAGVANTVNDAAQPNVTSLGTLTGLNVNGTITAVNITANTGVFTGNANGLSSVQGANVVGTLNSTTLGNSNLYVGTTAIALNRASGAQSLTGITSIDGYASTVSTNAQPNITSVGTLSSLSVSGNTTSGNFIGVFANGTSNISIPASAGNINLSAAGNANIVVVTGTGANIAGTLNVTGNANVGNLGTAGSVIADTLTANTKVVIGNTAINWAQVTTSSTSANQAISTVAVSGITGVQWLVRGADASGSKYTVATVNAVTDGANVDWAIYGGVTLGTTTGSLSVGISGGNIELHVTPSSSNSTVWVTQYKYI